MLLLRTWVPGGYRSLIVLNLECGKSLPKHTPPAKIFLPAGSLDWPLSMCYPSVTVLLRAWGGGSEKALDRLAPLVYRELRQMAGRMMAAERPNHTLQPTALVNEAYLRLVDARQVSWQDRAHFFGICARAMRQILVDHARSRASAKRGGGEVALELEEGLVAARAPEVNLLELDDVLNRLAELDPRKSQVVEMRYFAGLSLKETAEALKVSAETVRRDWKMAQAWLHRELSRNKQDE